MSRFLQLHYLTAYPPSCCNRDESGRPKTAVYGGVNRLRISSQSLKRAVRTSEVMQSSLSGKMGVRSRRFGNEIIQHLTSRGVERTEAKRIAGRIASIFGRLDDKSKDGRISQLAFISPDERSAALELAEKAADGGSMEETAVELRSLVLRSADTAADLALFGRMLADAPEFNRYAAVQVAHGLTTHAAHAEKDYFTAVDDLGKPGDAAGAGFVGEGGFGSGVFYIYVAVELSRLIGNLDGDRELAATAVSALARAFALVSPSGKRSGFAQNVRAAFIRAESGSVQPRSLACAFLKPVVGDDLLATSIQKLHAAAADLDSAYGAAADDVLEMDVATRSGTLDDIAMFAAGQVQVA